MAPSLLGGNHEALGFLRRSMCLGGGAGLPPTAPGGSPCLPSQPLSTPTQPGSSLPSLPVGVTQAVEPLRRNTVSLRENLLTPNRLPQSAHVTWRLSPRPSPKHPNLPPLGLGATSYSPVNTDLTGAAGTH